MSTIRHESDQGIAVITLDRPKVRNAISQEMVTEIHACLDELFDIIVFSQKIKNLLHLGTK